jgi:hypothetical protein
VPEETQLRSEFYGDKQWLLKLTSSRLLVNRHAQVSEPVSNVLISPRDPFTVITFFGIYNEILMYEAYQFRPQTREDNNPKILNYHKG